MLAVLRGGGDGDLTVLLGLLHGQVGKVTGHGIVGLAGFADEVQGIIPNCMVPPPWRKRTL